MSTFMTENPILSHWLLNTALHSLVISLAGWLVLTAFGRSSAVLRSTVLVGVMSAMLATPLLGWYFQSGTSYGVLVPIELKTDTAPAGEGLSIGAADNGVARSHTETAGQNSDRLEAAHRGDPPNPRWRIPWMMLAAGTWLLGCVFHLVKLGYDSVFIFGYRAGLRRLNDDRVDRILASVLHDSSGQKHPVVYLSPTSYSPFAAGLVSPCIVLPEDLIRSLGDRDLENVILHEVSHIVHRDNWMGLVQRLLTALYWWNPFVRWINSGFAVAREEVSDNLVMQQTGSPDSYARCLVSLAEKTAHARSLPVTVGLGCSHLKIHERIKSILVEERNMSTKCSKPLFATVMCCCLLAALVVNGCNAVFDFARDDAKTEAFAKQEIEILNNDLLSYLGEPIPVPDDLEERFTKHRLNSAVLAACDELGWKVKNLIIDDSEYPILLGAQVEMPDTGQSLSHVRYLFEAKAMQGYTYSGAVTGGKRYTTHAGDKVVLFSFSLPVAPARERSNRQGIRMSVLYESVKTSSSVSIAQYIGEPVPFPADLDEKYTKDALLEAFRKGCKELGYRIIKLHADDSEFPVLIYCELENREKFEAGLVHRTAKAMEAYEHHGSIGGASCHRWGNGFVSRMAVNLTPIRLAGNDRQRQQAGNRDMVRMENLYHGR